MTRLGSIVVCLVLGLIGVGASAAIHSSSVSGNAHVERLSRRSSHGNIAVKAGRRNLPGNGLLMLLGGTLLALRRRKGY